MAAPQTRQQFGPAGDAFGRLLQVFPPPIRSLADFPTFEAAHNPDKGAGAQPGGAIDSDPYAVAIKDGFQVVADAGGNDLLKVDSRAGSRCLRPSRCGWWRRRPT